MKCELDELMLTDIDEDTKEAPLYSTDSLTFQTLTNHTCSITKLCYNDIGSILASGCQRGLVYVHFLEVRYSVKNIFTNFIILFLNF